MSESATAKWIELLNGLLRYGRPASPRPGGVGAGETIELLAFTSEIGMQFPIMTNLERKLSYRFMCAEAWWILSGDDRVKTIVPYAPSISRFSDDGVSFHGAYGPRVIGQLHEVVLKLKEDQSTRQAVMTIWRQNPPKSKDIPCTISVQWIIRDGYLNCIDTMRSSDVWLGWPYDVFNFSMLSLYIALTLRDLGIEVKLGALYLCAGSQHLYLRNIEAARKCVRLGTGCDQTFPISLNAFVSPANLIEYLYDAKDGADELSWFDGLL